MVISRNRLNNLLKKTKKAPEIVVVYEEEEGVSYSMDVEGEDVILSRAQVDELKAQGKTIIIVRYEELKTEMPGE